MQPHKSLYSDVLVNFFFVIFVLKDAMIFFHVWNCSWISGRTETEFASFDIFCVEIWWTLFNDRIDWKTKTEIFGLTKYPPLLLREFRWTTSHCSNRIQALVPKNFDGKNTNSGYSFGEKSRITSSNPNLGEILFLPSHLFIFKGLLASLQFRTISNFGETMNYKHVTANIILLIFGNYETSTLKTTFGQCSHPFV